MAPRIKDVIEAEEDVLEFDYGEDEDLTKQTDISEKVSDYI